MLSYIAFGVCYINFRAKRFSLKLLCAFIPNKDLRRKTRNVLFEKYCQPPKRPKRPCEQDRVVLLREVDNHLPRKVLAKVNAFENEYFMAKNAQILAKAHATNERERERERERVRAAA